MDNNVIVGQITLGYFATWALQWLKSASWFPVLQNEGTKVANTIAAVIAAAVAITGLDYTFDPTAHTLLISNFSLAMVATAVWHWATQYVIQQGWYIVRFQKA